VSRVGHSSTSTLISSFQTFRNPKPELVALLAESGAADANGVRGKDASKKKARRDKNVDMEKLADGLQKLSEDDLLHVVTLVHDNKTSETYTKNDVESMLVTNFTQSSR
jgi:transcription initiation factor IIF auxiliary subunit